MSHGEGHDFSEHVPRPNLAQYYGCQPSMDKSIGFYFAKHRETLNESIVESIS
jgi:hypothetical protein